MDGRHDPVAARPADRCALFTSFRTDVQTGGIRTSLERTLDPQYRVSGILDPKRRWPGVVRFTSYILFALKYANPKYLNLEAGDEWKGRLWRSLGEARGVVIDIADLTAAVAAEIQLCEKCVGLRRMLFVVRDTADPAAWQERIGAILPSANASDLRTAVWGAGVWSKIEFESRVADFGRSLPRDPAGFEPAARELAEELPGQTFEESNRWLGIEIALGIVVGTLATMALNVVSSVSSNLSPAVLVLYLIWYTMLFFHYVSFRRNSGSRRRRKIAAWTVIPILISPLLIGLLLYATQQVRDAAQRLRDSNNLKIIGIAMHNAADFNDPIPAANAPSLPPPLGSGNKYPVSWRVLLLSHLEDGAAVARRYRDDEPWDGPNNRQLLALMPRVYRHPKADELKTPVGYTHYRVFASPAGINPTALFTDAGRGPTFSSIPDGTSRTIMVVQAQEAVPWTKPEALLYDAARPLPKLGGIFRSGYNVLLCDGSVSFFRHTIPENQLRAWITRDGGETVVGP